MFELQTWGSLYSTSMMLDGMLRAQALMVEGPDDVLVIEGHKRETLRVLVGSGGKQEVVRAARAAESTGVRDVTFLVDRDFDDYLPSGERLPSTLLSSDTHDLFTDLIEADPSTLVHVIRVQASSWSRQPGKMTQAVDAESAIIIAKRLAVQLAAIRVASARLGLGASFKGVGFQGAPIETSAIKYLVCRVAERNASMSFSVEALESTAEGVLQEFAGAEGGLYGDHDFFSALNYAIGVQGPKVGASSLQRAFISAVRCEAMASTGWHRQIEFRCQQLGSAGFDCGIRSA